MPVAVLLVAALAVTGLLAVAALTTEKYQRATAERVLRDYASFAAASYASRAAQQLFYVFGPALDTSRAEPCCGLADSARAGRLPWGRTWSFGVAAVPTDSGIRLAVYRLVVDSAGRLRSARGFTLTPSALTPALRTAYQNAPLLPRALVGETNRDSLGTVRVTAGSAELFASSPWSDTLFVARTPIGDYFGPVQVAVALRSSAARSLVIGGLPRSRLPFIAGLFSLAAVLVVWALIQLLRERQLARLRADFVSGVSHELRTPLAQVRMFAETLLLDRVRSDEERQRSLSIIDQEARRLSHLVDNILHFTRTERVALRLEPRPMALAPLLRDVVEGFQPLADNRRVTLSLEAPEELVVPVDEAALRQVVINLLDNAVKYGPEGQVVRIHAAAVNGDAQLAVEDQGPGIPDRDHDKVWRRFVRLERDQNSAVAGTGIGLAVVRELIGLHQGRCWIERSPAGGARVVVALPLERA